MTHETTKWTVGQEVGTQRRDQRPYKGVVISVTPHRVTARLETLVGTLERTFTLDGRPYPYSRVKGWLSPWTLAMAASLELDNRNREAVQKRVEEREAAEAQAADKQRAAIDLLQAALDRYVLCETEASEEARALLKRMRPEAGQ